jgi:hypothetical protein
LIANEQVREWLKRLQAAADDYCQARHIAYEIQRRSRPGPLHTAASECRIASVQATSGRATPFQIGSARSATVARRRTLEDLLRKAAA